MKKLSKRRSSDASIKSYMEQHDGDSVILGTGTFFKKGFGINNWKTRGYFIKGDKKVRGDDNWSIDVLSSLLYNIIPIE